MTGTTGKEGQTDDEGQRRKEGQTDDVGQWGRKGQTDDRDCGEERDR